jgi:hypothetical protein
LVGLTVVDHLACFSDILVLASWLLRFPLSPAGAGHLAVLKWFSCACVPGCWYLLRLSGFLVLIGCCRRLGHASVVSLCSKRFFVLLGCCRQSGHVSLVPLLWCPWMLVLRFGCFLSLAACCCPPGHASVASLFWFPWLLRFPFFGWCWPPGHASVVSLCCFPWLLVIIALQWVSCPDLLLQTTWSCFSCLLCWCPWLSILRLNRFLVLASCC